MAKRPVNAVRGKQGFQRTGRADPLEAAGLGIPSLLQETLTPASAPPGYHDVHSAFLDRRRASSWNAALSPALTPAEIREARAQAENPETSSEELERLSSISDAATLSRVARHGNTSPETLHSMALRLDHEDYEDVICRIGENRAALPATMVLLATSKSAKVKVWAAWHDNTPEDCLETLRDNADTAVRQGVAENPNTSSATLLLYGSPLYEGDSACRVAAHMNDRYPSTNARLALASDSRTPQFEKELLAWDSNAQVRKAARQALGTNRPTSSELAAEASRRGLPRHVVAGIRQRTDALEDKTAAQAE